MTTHQSKNNYLAPFIIMVVLMSLVGLITSLNQQFQGPMRAAYLVKGGAAVDVWTTLLTFAFFTAYLVMGPVSSSFIKRNGYKNTLLTGLAILFVSFGLYILSAFVFNTIDLPNFQDAIDTVRSTKQSYSGETMLPNAYWIFLAAAFIAGTAMTFLQAVINPYIVVCDVKGTTGVQRQNIAGTGNSTMTTIGPLIVAHLIFMGKEGLDIQTSSLYIPMGVLMVLVALLFFALKGMRLPEISSVSTKKEEKLPDSICSFSHVVWGLVALFFYVGVEVCVGANIVLYAQDDLGFSFKDATFYAFLYWGGMLVGRFFSSFLNMVPARTQLTFTTIAASIALILALVTKNPYFLCVIGLFHSVMWPSIFSLALEGLGRYTAKASGFLMMGCFGGAVLPLLQGTLKTFIGDWGNTWYLVFAGEMIMLFYALIGSRVRKRDHHHA